MGTLWSSIKQIKAPYVFDLENGIAVHAMQWNCESSLAVEEVSCVSRVVVGPWGIFTSYGGDGNSILVFLQRRQHSCLVMMATSGI